MTNQSAIIGVTEHGNSAIMVAISSEGNFLDRRTAELTQDLPTMPYHHQGSWAIGRYRDSPWAKDINFSDAIKLIKKVEKSAALGAQKVLAQLATDLPMPISAITLRACPELPNSIEERIRDNRAQTYADTVIYLQAVANAAKDREWTVHWYDRDLIDTKAPQVTILGKQAGTPWQERQKQAAAAALALIK